VRERTLAELGQHFADGNIDYRGLGAKLLALGEPRSAFAALQVGELRDARADMLRRLNAPGAPPAVPALGANAPGLPRPAVAAPRAPAMPGLPFAADVWGSPDGYNVDPTWPGNYFKAGPDGS
jgi:hypothetical protein